MSNLWFNIRFGKYHWQLRNDWQIGFNKNPFWDEDPEAYELVSWFEVYCAFGRHFGI
jgi:hypothetical protein